MTDQSILCFIQLNITFAFRACQYFEELLADGHERCPPFVVRHLDITEEFISSAVRFLVELPYGWMKASGKFHL